MCSVQAFYVLRETERARSALVEIDGLTGLKLLKSGFALPLLDNVPLPGEVWMMERNLRAASSSSMEST